MQTEYSKIYILIKENVDIGHALLACAHGTLMCYLKFKENPDFDEYLKNSFRKCVCKVNDKEFENAKKFDDYVIVTKSALGNDETALVFKPRKEWPKAFQFYKLWKDKFEPDKSKYKKFDTKDIIENYNFLKNSQIQLDTEAQKILENHLWDLTE